MASVAIEGTDLVVHLSVLEVLGAFDWGVRAPLAHVQSAWVAADPWRELRGIRAPGTGIPRVIMLGTMRGSFGKDFCAVYGRKPALIVELKDARFSRWVITLAEPAVLAASIMSARSGSLSA